MPKIGLETKRVERGVCVAAATLLLAAMPAIAEYAGGSASAAGGSITVTTPRPDLSRTVLGVYTRKDGQMYAGVHGTTSGTKLPTASDTDRPVPPPVTVTPTPTPTPPPTPTSAAGDSPASTGTASTSAAPAPSPSVTTTPAQLIVPPAKYATPAGVFPAGAANAYAAPVNLTPYVGVPTAQTHADISVTDGSGASGTLDADLYQQTPTTVRATTAKVGSAGNVSITATLTDQFGLPVVGAPLRLFGAVAGTAGPRVDQLGFTNALGQVTFTGPGAGTGSGTGYGTGGYTAYFDHNINDSHGGNEPGYEVVHGTVSMVAPGHSLYHNDKRIKTAGGVYADAHKGSKTARSKGFQWIDQDGQLTFLSQGQKAAGASRISQAGQLVWVNAHGSPFNPKWLKKGRFETKSWDKIKHHKGLRDAAKTLKQDAKLGLSVEWEVKDIKPFNKAGTLDAAFTNLEAAARQYYGASWASRVQIKVLSNLKGGQKYALKVLKHAHAHGFTTMYLARGKATGVQIPVTAAGYVDYVRGAAGGVYPTIPPASQNTAVVAKKPHV